MNNWRNDSGVKFRCGYILGVWDHLPYAADIEGQIFTATLSHVIDDDDMNNVFMVQNNDLHALVLYNHTSNSDELGLSDAIEYLYLNKIHKDIIDHPKEEMAKRIEMLRFAITEFYPNMIGLIEDAAERDLFYKAYYNALMEMGVNNLLCPPLSFPDEKRVSEIYDKVKARYIRKLSGETIRSFVDRRFYVPRSIMRLVGR